MAHSFIKLIRDYLYLPLNKKKVENRSVGGFKKSLKSSGSNKSLFITWGIMGLAWCKLHL